MLRNGRRVLYHPQFVSGYFAAALCAKADLMLLREKPTPRSADDTRGTARSKGRACKAQGDRGRATGRARPKRDAELGTLIKSRFSGNRWLMSASLPKAHKEQTSRDVRFVP